MTYVVDTTVFLRWWVDQAGWQHARRVQEDFLAGQVALMTPDFTRIELAEVLRKKALLTGLLNDEQYLVAAASLDALNVEIVALDADGLLRAAGLASRRSLRLYDALGASLALDRGCPLLTGDAKAARALAGAVEVEVLRGIDL